MKKIFFIAAIILGCFSIKANAQVSVSLGLNIGSQPEWGPVGYDHADYYYIPDADVYYDVPAHQYVYYDNNVWIHNRVLPARYHFDRYNSYKVVVNERRPWEHNTVIRERYAGYRGRHGQALIRESRDERYRNHWREERHDNGNHYGERRHEDHDRGRGHDRDHGHGHDH